MFSVGEAIIYRSHGVCKIVGKEEVLSCEKVRPYYVLKPIFQNDSVYYAPIGNKQVESRMHPLLTKKEVFTLIESLKDGKEIWVDDDKERQRGYKEILEDCNRYALAKYIISLHIHQKQLEEQGRTLYAADKQFLTDAEKALYDEFAFILDIKQEQVPDFISENMGYSIN